MHWEFCWSINRGELSSLFVFLCCPCDTVWTRTFHARVSQNFKMLGLWNLWQLRSVIKLNGKADWPHQILHKTNKIESDLKFQRTGAWAQSRKVQKMHSFPWKRIGQILDERKKQFLQGLCLNEAENLLGSVECSRLPLNSYDSVLPSLKGLKQVYSIVFLNLEAGLVWVFLLLS